MDLTLHERLGLAAFVGLFSLLQGLCGFYLARQLKLNSLLWALFSFLPVVGVFALLTLQSQVVSWREASEQNRAALPVLFNYRRARFRLIASLLLWLYVGGSLLNFLPVPKIIIGILWLAGAAVIIGKSKLRLPDCPRCGKNLGGLFGPFCPECLGALSPGSTGAKASCTACGKSLQNSGGKRGRNFRVCGCSYCGFLLDKSGLQ